MRKCLLMEMAMITNKLPPIVMKISTHSRNPMMADFHKSPSLWSSSWVVFQVGWWKEEFWVGGLVNVMFKDILHDLFYRCEFKHQYVDYLLFVQKLVYFCFSLKILILHFQIVFLMFNNVPNNYSSNFIKCRYDRHFYKLESSYTDQQFILDFVCFTHVFSFPYSISIQDEKYPFIFQNISNT